MLPTECIQVHTLNFKVNKYNTLKWRQGTSVCKDLNTAEKLLRLCWSCCRLHCSYLTHDWLQHQFIVNQSDNIQGKLHNNKQVMRTTTWKPQAASFADWILKKMSGHTRVEVAKHWSFIIRIPHKTSLASWSEGAWDGWSMQHAWDRP
jgi:hypothetical protein